MSILKQFEMLTPDEIILMEQTMRTSIEVGEKKISSFNEFYKNYIEERSKNNINKSNLFNSLFFGSFTPEELEEEKKHFDTYNETIKKFRIILNKLEPLKQLVNNE